MIRDTSQKPLICPEPGGWVALCMAGCFDGSGGALTIATGTRSQCESEARQHHQEDLRMFDAICPSCGRGPQ